MRIDLPLCSFKPCKYCLDGNCIKKSEHERCEYRMLSELRNSIDDSYDLNRLKELVKKDRKGLSELHNKFPEKGQEVWYWDSKNGISRGIVDFVDDALNEFGVDFPGENDFDIFVGSAWGTCIVASKEAALEKMKENK